MRTALEPSARRATMTAIAIALALALAGCSTSDEATSGTDATDGSQRPTIVVTTSILGDVTSNVVGDLADVEVIIPPGADPHAFEPSAQQAAQLRDADVVVAVGLGLEAGLADTLDAAADDGTPVFEIGPELSPLPFGEGHAEEPATDGADEHGHEDDLDPHVWMDPDRMAAASLLIAEQVAAATGLDADVLRGRAEAYDQELLAADEAVQAALAAVPDDRRTLVTNHEALGYFADRYGFEVVATVIPGGGTDAEPSAAQIAELAQLLEAEGVTAIFAENVDDTGLAETLAAEVGQDVEVVTLYTDALGEPGSGADTYVGLLVTDAERIGEALAG